MLTVKKRWQGMEGFKINVALIIEAAEKAQSRNQMLTVSFDDLCLERNKRRLLLEQLKSQLSDLRA